MSVGPMIECSWLAIGGVLLTAADRPEMEGRWGKVHCDWGLRKRRRSREVVSSGSFVEVGRLNRYKRRCEMTTVEGCEMAGWMSEANDEMPGRMGQLNVELTMGSERTALVKKVEQKNVSPSRRWQ